ncbi:hypothetical protein ACJDT4_14800 [Clostridium neuense]|uniref:Uncharacterized protein n=1 Tax=Clostridium neuense TaxID=1728934 RepID=A0ABW8TL78_9CLOT
MRWFSEENYICLGVRFGAGPRDGLMIVVTKKTGKSVRTIRTFIEVVALIIGLIL